MLEDLITADERSLKLMVQAMTCHDYKMLVYFLQGLLKANYSSLLQVLLLPRPYLDFARRSPKPFVGGKSPESASSPCRDSENRFVSSLQHSLTRTAVFRPPAPITDEWMEEDATMLFTLPTLDGITLKVCACERVVTLVDSESRQSLGGEWIDVADFFAILPIQYEEAPILMAQQGQSITLPQKAKEERTPLYSFLDTPTLRIMYGYLSGFDLADARVVAKQWNNFITCWDTDLPCIFLKKVSVKSLKVWLEEGGQKKAIHVEATEGSRPYTHSRGDATDFGSDYEYRTLSFTVTSQEELSEKLPPLLRSSYIHCFRFQNLFLRTRFAQELGNVAGTISIGDFLFDNVSFNALRSWEFLWFFFDFSKIRSVDVENCTVPREHIDNDFLLSMARAGVQKLLLPKYHPLGAEEYLMDLEGIGDFLNRAPAGRIELAARHLSPPTRWNETRYVKEIRAALLRPNCSVNLYIFGHKTDPDAVCLLKNLDGTRCGPPPAKRPRIVVDSRLQVDVEPTVIRVATQSLLRSLVLIGAWITAGKDA
ncbi:hypothetical protein AAVH_17110 [Aphelenchoides avenae]|nr:hypothetical protein AAVH_17110 [Aphelenchus avenae]